jgi:hypothetical protein
VYADRDRPHPLDHAARNESDAADLPSPPRADLEELLKLTALGDVEGLNAALDRLRVSRPDLDRFISNVRSYTRQFQMNRIRSLLEALLARPS